MAELKNLRGLSFDDLNDYASTNWPDIYYYLANMQTEVSIRSNTPRYLLPGDRGDVIIMCPDTDDEEWYIELSPHPIGIFLNDDKMLSLLKSCTA